MGPHDNGPGQSALVGAIDPGPSSCVGPKRKSPSLCFGAIVRAGRRKRPGGRWRYAATDGSFQALVCLQFEQTRSPGQELLNSVRHIRHLRVLETYFRSDSGFLFLLESLIVLNPSAFEKLAVIYLKYGCNATAARANQPFQNCMAALSIRAFSA